MKFLDAVTKFQTEISLTYSLDARSQIGEVRLRFEVSHEENEEGRNEDLSRENEKVKKFCVTGLYGVTGSSLHCIHSNNERLL